MQPHAPTAPAAQPSQRPGSPLRDLGPRLAALAFGVLALAAVGSTILAWGEPGLRTVARVVFAVVLLEMAAMAWRAPRLRPRRWRERAMRLLTAMASPERHAEYAETSPQVGLAEAFLDDWDALQRERALLPAGTLTADEAASLDALAEDIEGLRGELRGLASAPVPELATQEAWMRLVASARRAFKGLAPPGPHGHPMEGSAAP